MFVVDSSIFSSIVVKDEFYVKARKFLLEHSKSELITADLAFVETANTLWKHTFIYRRIPYEKFKVLKQSIEPLIRSSTARIYSASEALVEALDNALKYGITVYDSIYVTLAMKYNYKLVSFDRKLRDKLKKQNLDIICVL